MPNNQSGSKKSCNTCSSSTAPTITPSSTVAGSVPLQTSNTQAFGKWQSPKGGYRKTRRSRRKHKRSRRVR